MKDSLLMRDSTEGDGKAEIVMDYVMSWSLRHAVKNETNEKTPILYDYCRYMLYKLLQLKAPLEQIVFEKVEVWKEWQYMDLCVEVELKNNGKNEYYALLVENKYYGKLRDNQLQRYQEIFKTYYDAKKGKGITWILRYSLVSCIDRQEQFEKLYTKGMKNTEFKGLTFYDLLHHSYWDETAGKYKDSESEIFNEFWLRRW